MLIDWQPYLLDLFGNNIWTKSLVIAALNKPDLALFGIRFNFTGSNRNLVEEQRPIYHEKPSDLSLSV